MTYLTVRWNKFKRFSLPLAVAYLGQGALGLMLKTCKISVSGLDHFEQAAEQDKCLLMLWHNRLAPITHFLKKYAPQYLYGALISKSRDGDLLAALVNRYSQAKAIRVAHNAKHQGLRDVIQHLNDEKRVIVVTPDGPQGPRYRIKPGIAVAAKTTAAKIIPLSWSCTSFWQLRTWDKLIIPKPFSTIHLVFGTPLAIPEDSPLSLDDHLQYLESSLLQLDQNAHATLPAANAPL